MTSGVVRVSYPTLQDLYFRTKNLRLANENYMVSFMTWVKGGIAFNVRGAENRSRSISYFGDLYEKLLGTSDYTTIKSELGVAITRYYEDFFLLYQDHLTGVLNSDGKKGRAVKALHANLLLIPSFEDCPKMGDVFSSEVVDIDSYEPAHPDELRRDLVTNYAPHTGRLYKAAAMYYDHSLKQEGDVVLLEVNHDEKGCGERCL